MADESEDNVVSLRPKLDPLKPMEAYEWGRELYKSYLMSTLGMPQLAADHKAVTLDQTTAAAIATVTLRSIDMLLEGLGEIGEAEKTALQENAVKQLAERIRLELVRQAENIFFCDPEDRHLFDEGPPEDIGSMTDKPLYNQFDFEELARRVM